MTCRSAKGHLPGIPLRVVAGFSVALLLSLLAISPVAADFTLRDWAYAKPITLPLALGEEELVELVPDQGVFAQAAEGLADLRIIEEASQREVPYNQAIDRAQETRTTHRVSIQDLGHLSGQYTSFVADLGREGLLHNEVEILTSSENFQREVVVEGSNDLITWAVLQEEQRIFSAVFGERKFTDRHTRVQYPESTVRYLRVKILRPDEEPLDIRGAGVFFVKKTPAVEVARPVTLLTREEDPEKRVSRLLLDLGSKGMPSDRLIIVTPQVNFYREMTLEGSNDRKEWTVVSRSGVVYSFKTPKFTGEQLSVPYPETTSRYLRLTIHNEDNPPLTIDEVRLFGALRRLIFSARPGEAYTLYYGNPQATFPSYDLERVLPYLATQDLPQASLGVQTQNLLFVPKATPFTERFPWLLPVVVTVAAVIIGLFLLLVLLKARKSLPPSPGG